MGKTVRISIDNVPPITPEERKQLLDLTEANTDPIDFSDIPPLPEEYFKNAVRGRLYRPNKQQVTLRVDADVLDWFKRRTAKGYQTDINRALREYMTEQQKKTG